MDINIVYTCLVSCPDGLVDELEEFDTYEEAEAYGEGFINGCVTAGLDDINYEVIERVTSG